MEKQLNKLNKVMQEKVIHLKLHQQTLHLGKRFSLDVKCVENKIHKLAVQQ